MKAEKLERNNEKEKENEFSGNIKKETDKMTLVRKLLDCFYEDGIADDSVCIVTSKVDKLTSKQKAFIDEYFYENGPKSMFVNKVKLLFYNVAKGALHWRVKDR